MRIGRQIFLGSPAARKTFLLLLLSHLLCAATTVTAQQRRSVVLLFDENKDFPALTRLEQSLTSALKAGTNGQLDIYSEYMDLSRFPDEDYRKRLGNFFRQKYYDKRIDLILPVMGPSLDFLLEYRNELFPNVPIVFCGIDKRELEGKALGPNVTGVLVKREFKPTLALALKLHPDVNQFVLIGGSSGFNTYWESQARAELREFEDRVPINYWLGYSMEDIRRRVAQLPPHTVILYLHMFRDVAGNTFSPDQALTLIAEKANVPIYVFVDQFIGSGPVGGHVWSIDAQGAKAAELGLRILRGESPRNIAVYDEDANVDMFDWRQLQRWKISESSLPPGSVVLYRQPSVWEAYKRYIIAAIFLVLAQAFIIAALLWQRAERRKTEAELIRSNDQLRLAMDSGKSVGWDLDVKSGRNTWFGDLRAVFGIPSSTYSESVGDFRHRLHPEDQEPVWKAFSDARQGQKPYAAEFRVIRADGTVRWLTARGEFYYPGKGDATRMLGMAVDITEVKQAEAALSGMSRKLIEAHEEERTWIARELHDDINQRLALLAVSLDALSQEPPASTVELRGRISKERELVSGLGRDVQALSHRLHSSKLEYLGLAAAASSLCRELSDQQKVEIDFHSDGVPKQLPSEISLCLFRVMQEALQNGMKHSGSRHFEVRLGSALNEIQLSVRDSGIGFDLDEAMNGRGVGLSSMQERLKLVGGEFSIESQLQHGTTIHARVPLSPRMKSAGAGD